LPEYKDSDLTNLIICCFYNVYGQLGYGFLEKVYENAMIVELKEKVISAIAQSPIPVFYKGKTVGEYFADILVENKVIVEIKAVRALTTEHEAQILNYLKATDVEVGLLLNFGPKPEVRRKVFENSRKTNGIGRRLTQMNADKD
jgi:GxxExxY protein